MTMVHFSIHGVIVTIVGHGINGNFIQLLGESIDMGIGWIKRNVGIARVGWSRLNTIMVTKYLLGSSIIEVGDLIRNKFLTRGKLTTI